MSNHRTNFVGSVSILDRGDAPAQAIIDKNTRSLAQRVTDETKAELQQVMTRVETIYGSFEMSQDIFNNMTNLEYVSDVSELEEILRDQVKKKKYQQQVTIFIVGYEDTCTQKLRLLQQINEFFMENSKLNEEEEMQPKTPDIDLDQVGEKIEDSLATAAELTQRIGDLNKEMIDYVANYTANKASHRGRKKLEKSLQQAKDDAASISEKLLSVQSEVEEKEERISQLFKQLETKNLDLTRFKNLVDISKKKTDEYEVIKEELNTKNQQIQEQQKVINNLETELASANFTYSQAESRLEHYNTEYQQKINDLQSQLDNSALVADQVKLDSEKLHNQQIIALHGQQAEKVKELNSEHKEETRVLNEEITELQRQLAEAREEIASFKVVQSKEEGSPAQEVDLVLSSEDVSRASSDQESRPSTKGTGKPGKGGKSHKLTTTKSKEKEKEEVPKVAVQDEASDQAAAAAVVEEVKPAKAKSNLEPTFNDSFDLFDNVEWGSVPPKDVRGRFEQYRGLTQSKVRELEEQIELTLAKTRRKVNTLKSQFLEHKSKWEKERKILIEQVDQAHVLQTEAEKEADAAMFHLEEFINEQEQLEEQEEKKRKELTASVAASSQDQSSPLQKEATDVSQPALPTAEGTEIELEELIQQTDDAKSERERTKTSLHFDDASPKPETQNLSPGAKSVLESPRKTPSRSSARSHSHVMTPRNLSASISERSLPVQVNPQEHSRIMTPRNLSASISERSLPVQVNPQEHSRNRELSELSIHFEVTDDSVPPKISEELSAASYVAEALEETEVAVDNNEKSVLASSLNIPERTAEVQEMNARLAGSGAVSAPPAIESTGQEDEQLIGKVEEMCSTPKSHEVLPLTRERPISPMTPKTSWFLHNSGENSEANSDEKASKDSFRSHVSSDALILGITEDQDHTQMSVMGETQIIIDSSKPELTTINIIPEGDHQKQIYINIRQTKNKSIKSLHEEEMQLSRTVTPFLKQLTETEKCENYLTLRDNELSFMDTPSNLLKVLKELAGNTKNKRAGAMNNSGKNSRCGTLILSHSQQASPISEQTISGNSVSFSTPNGSTISVITPVKTGLSIRNQSSGYKTMHIKSFLSDNDTSSPPTDKISHVSKSTKLQPEQILALKNMKELMMDDNLPNHLQQILQALRSAFQILHSNGSDLSGEHIARTLLIVTLAEQLIQESIQLGIVPRSMLTSLADVCADHETVINSIATHKKYMKEQKTSEKICKNYAEKLEVQKNLKNLPKLDLLSVAEKQEQLQAKAQPFNYPTETTIGTVIPRELTSCTPDIAFNKTRRKTEFIFEDMFLFKVPTSKKFLEPIEYRQSMEAVLDQQDTKHNLRNKITGLRKEKTDMSEVSVKSRSSIRNTFKSKLEDSRSAADMRKSKSPRVTPGPLIDEEEEEVDLPFPDDLKGNQTTDIGTSPILKQTSVPKKPSFILFDHPVVQEYLKSYDGVVSFKNVMSKIMLDRDMMSAAQILSDLEPVNADSDEKVQPQIEKMTKNIYLILEEVTNVVSSLLYSEREPVVSSLMMVSREPTLVTTSQEIEKTADAPQPVAGPRTGLRSAVSVQSDLSTKLTVQDLKNQYERLEKKYTEDSKKYESQLKHNTVLMKNMQGTISELQRELSNLGKRKKSADIYQSTSSPSVDSSIMFTRLDSERNSKIMKRAVMDEKLQSNSYKKATAKMSDYVSLPAKRFSHLVKKYIHHCRMKGIEDKVKKSKSLDENVFETLDKMEDLQNRRAKRWAEKMDEMGSERLQLANELMDTFDMIEEESGVFLIKPIYSYRGRNVRESKQIGKLNRPYRQPREYSLTERESSFTPAPTPASNIRFIKQQEKPAGPVDPLMVRREPLRKLQDGDQGMYGSSINTGGYQSTWNMSLSHEKGDSSQPLPINSFNTPRLLEIDINRMLISQNNISNQVPGLMSDDRLVNAAHNSTRGFVAVNRPTVQIIPQKENFSSGAAEGKRQSDVSTSATSQKRVQLIDGDVKSLPGSTPLPPIANGSDKQTANPQWCA